MGGVSAMRFTVNVLSVLVAVSLVSGASAQYDPEYLEMQRAMAFHPLTNMPEEAEDVQTYYVFPDRELVDGMYSMESGEKVEVLIGFHNDGETPINVSGVMASLNNPVDFRMHIQNFTLKHIGTPVAPGGELSVSYHFQPDPALDPRDFQIAITAFYEADGEMFSSTFFNSTVNIVDSSSTFDTQLVFLVLIVCGIGAVVGSFSFSQVASATGMNRSSKPKAEVSAPQEGEWLKGTSASGGPGARKAVKKSKSKK